MENAAMTPASGEASHDTSWSRQEELLDQALEETFPASDPVAVMQFT
jgi:hypothetical protein